MASTFRFKRNLRLGCFLFAFILEMMISLLIAFGVNYSKLHINEGDGHSNWLTLA